MDLATRLKALEQDGVEDIRISRARSQRFPTCVCRPRDFQWPPMSVVLEAFTGSVSSTACPCGAQDVEQELRLLHGWFKPAVGGVSQGDRESDFRDWILHMRSFRISKVCGLVEREDDRHGCCRIPKFLHDVGRGSWRLTLLLTSAQRWRLHCNDHLLEEPENGVHPMALDAIYDSLKSIYDGQVLVATHSPVFLRMAKPEEVLCFAKTEDGATDIVRGDDHPMLRDWQGSVDMDLLFATGVGLATDVGRILTWSRPSRGCWHDPQRSPHVSSL